MYFISSRHIALDSKFEAKKGQVGQSLQTQQTQGHRLIKVEFEVCNNIYRKLKICNMDY
jgi:hypothetical protein